MYELRFVWFCFGFNWENKLYFLVIIKYIFPVIFNPPSYSCLSSILLIVKDLYFYIFIYFLILLLPKLFSFLYLHEIQGYWMKININLQQIGSIY